MQVKRRPIDDFALAEFIGGKLPDRVRRQIIDSIKDDADAQELLRMAYDALMTAEKPDDAMRLISEKWRPAA